MSQLLKSLLDPGWCGKALLPFCLQLQCLLPHKLSLLLPPVLRSISGEDSPAWQAASQRSGCICRGCQGLEERRGGLSPPGLE